MPKLTLQVRTKDNLLELLASGESPAWVIAEEKLEKITDVQIVNWNGTQMIEAKFDRQASYYRDDGRLVIKISDSRIVNCHIEFNGQNPVRYIH